MILIALSFLHDMFIYYQKQSRTLYKDNAIDRINPIKKCYDSEKVNVI